VCVCVCVSEWHIIVAAAAAGVRQCVSRKMPDQKIREMPQIKLELW